MREMSVDHEKGEVENQSKNVHFYQAERLQPR